MTIKRQENWYSPGISPLKGYQFLRLNVVKEVKTFYNKTIMTLKKKMEKDARLWNNFGVLGFEELLLCKRLSHRKQSTCLCFFTKIPMKFFTKLEETNLKFMWKEKNTNKQEISSRKKAAGHNTVMWPQGIHHSHSDKDSIALTWKWISRLMEHNRRHISKPT